MSKVFNITVVNTFTKEKEEVKDYTTVGVAFHNEKTNTFSCKLKQGISISGDFVLFEQKAKD